MTNKENLMSEIANLKSRLAPKEAKRLQINMLERVALRLVSFSEECSQCNQCCDDLLNQISNIDTDYKQYNITLKSCISHLEKKHKLVTEGMYTGMYMCFGIALGMPFGISMGNIALGIPIGLAIGVAIGAGLDADAKKKGLVI